MTKDEKENKKQENNKQEKTWDKEEYIANKFRNRSIVFYIDKSKIFLDFSFYLMIITFSIALFNTYKVMSLPNKTSYYISSLDGKLYNNDYNQDKREKLRTAINTIKNKQNNQNK